jgi:hypothetical protein
MNHGHPAKKSLVYTNQGYGGQVSGPDTLNVPDAPRFTLYVLTAACGTATWKPR